MKIIDAATKLIEANPMAWPRLIKELSQIVRFISVVELTHELCLKTGTKEADFTGFDGTVYHYLYLSKNEYQMWRDGDVPTSYEYKE